MNDFSTNNARIATLVYKYLLQKLSADESVELDQWIATAEENQVTFNEMVNRTMLERKLENYNAVDTEGIWQKISNQVPDLNIPVVPISRKYKWWRFTMAAAVVLGIVYGGWYFLGNSIKQYKEKNIPVIVKYDVLPAGNKAILTLANGSHIILDSAGTGTIAKQERTTINKTHEGELVYNTSPSSSTPGPARFLYNTISTPRGGKYQLTLPDGSKAWLNAASSLRFPIAFTGNERKVELTGEAYFEIVHDKSKPFKVSMIPSSPGENKGEIIVLGTHFNANAYEEEADIKVTLLEGSVKVSGYSEERQGIKYLKPGQQAILNATIKEINVVSKDDPESAIAWINGRFSFEKISFAAMMRELSRWYNVDIIYEGKMPTNTIVGEVDRTMPLSELLATLEKMGNTHFKIEGRTVSVLP